jgi:hypothetical protein
MDSILNLFWNLNTTDNTKYIIIIVIIIGILTLCIFSGKKKTHKRNNKKKTKCEDSYMKCMQNNIRNNRNDFCYPCLDDGNAPDFFLNPHTKQWIKAS